VDAERGDDPGDPGRLIGWLFLGLVVGAALGSLATWYLTRQPAAADPAPARRQPAVLSEPDETAPAAGDDVRQALDATRGLLDELEKRYQLPGAEAPKTPRRKPGPKRPS